MGSTSRFAAVAAFAASLSLAATPISAAEMPRHAIPTGVAPTGVFDADSENADRYRGWYRRDRIDAGDVIGGILVLGTIAAVASAASRAGSANRDYRYPNRDYRTRDRDYDYDRDYRSRPDSSRMDGSRGIDRAVDMCAREVERNARVETVDGVTRTGEGWRVTGQLRTGEPFSCAIGADGRIEAVDYGRRGAAADDQQWNDDRYAAARSAQDLASAPPYPGGPVAGDTPEAPPAPADDGRYQTAQAPDFPG